MVPVLNVAGAVPVKPPNPLTFSVPFDPGSTPSAVVVVEVTWPLLVTFSVPVPPLPTSK